MQDRQLTVPHAPQGSYEYDECNLSTSTTSLLYLPTLSRSLVRSLSLSFALSLSFLSHKFALIDDCVLLNGSFNWTRQAETSNNENIMITNESFFVEQFKGEFLRKWEEFAATHIY